MTDKEHVVEEVESFLKSDREDHMDFINNLGGKPTVLEINENQNHKNRFIDDRLEEVAEEKELDADDLERDDWEPKFGGKWMKNGLFGQIAREPPYQELDFDKFSFILLRKYAENKDLKTVIDAITLQPYSDRRKELRIQLFNSLKAPVSPFYDIELYYKILNKMIEAKETAKKIIQEQGYEILSITYDSFSFLAENEEAEQVKNKVNSELEDSRMSLETYPSAVKFYNVAMFKDEEGEWFDFLTNGSKYTELKQNIASYLTDKEFASAHEEVSKAKNRLGTYKDMDVNVEKMKEYNKVLTEIKDSEDFTEEDEE